jgi:hypothetical protein
MGQQNGTSSSVVGSHLGSTEEPAPDRPADNGRSEVLPPRTQFWGFAAVALQLVLILLVVRNYEVAYRLHFLPVLCVVVSGFLVRAGLPARFRLGFFCLLSLAVIVFVLGWTNGLLVIGIGGGLIAVCRLPVSFALRTAVVVLAALVLAVLRLDLSRPFWPVLGSMFMFRLIVYLYESRREAARAPLGITVAYFFPLQNVCFLFFPIFDFKTFRDTYRAESRWQDAQVGVGFFVTGLGHLLAYRVIKYYLLPSPHQLGDLPHLALFLATNYALYLHVSGYFHIITGVFHLFGFEVPRTHHNYFLASSFTDIWRRINIPWKEFMAKLFFFPAFYAMRRFGTRVAMAVAALWVFVMTWVLHSYQVFWITGGFSLRVFDAGLWLAVGVLVAWNLQRELARSRRPRTAPDESVRGAVGLAARVVGMFVLVSFFWACWNTPGFLPFVGSQLTSAQWFAGWWWVIAGLGVLVAVGATAKLSRDRLSRWAGPRPFSPGRAAGLHVVILAAVIVIGLPEVSELFGSPVARKIGEIRRESVTPVEAAQAVQGYYEEIADAPVRAGGWLTELEGRAPKQQTHYTDMTRPADDLLEQELIPDWRGELAGSPISINRFGMRDRPGLVREKAPGVRRIAMVGSSVVMGYGVADDEPFPRRFEDQLNARREPGDPRYEILNFGTGKSFAIHRRVLLDRKVFDFDPDIVYVVGHQDEFLGTVAHLAKLLATGTELPCPGLKEVIQKAGIAPDTPWGEVQARLQPLAPQIVLAVYRDLVAECRRRGILAVWVYVPMPGVAEPGGLGAELVQVAERAGFVVVDLSDWAVGRRPADVKLSDADHHPNALGQRLIADRLLDAAVRRPDLLGGARVRP